MILKIFSKIFLVFIFLYSIPIFSSDKNLENPKTIEDVFKDNSNITKIDTKFNKDVNNFFKLNITNASLDAKIIFLVINVISYLQDVLNITYVRFISLFLIILYFFWLTLELITFIKDGENIKDFTYDKLKFTLILAIWIAFLNYGLAHVLSIIATPIIEIAHYFSDTILSSVSNLSQIALNKCESVNQFIASYNQELLLSKTTTSSLICMSTKLSPFFWQEIQFGLDTLTSMSILLYKLYGLIIIILGVLNVWFLLLPSLIIIFNICFTILFLPFTAIKETFGNDKYKVKYKGKIAEFFNAFVNMFKIGSLKSHIQVLVNSSIFFIFLSAVLSLNLVLLAQIFKIENNNIIFNNVNPFTVIIINLLVMYISNKAYKFVKKINSDTELTDKISNDIKNIGKNAFNVGKKIVLKFKK